MVAQKDATAFHREVVSPKLRQVNMNLFEVNN